MSPSNDKVIRPAFPVKWPYIVDWILEAALYIINPPRPFFLLCVREGNPAEDSCSSKVAASK